MAGRITKSWIQSGAQIQPPYQQSAVTGSIARWQNDVASATDALVALGEDSVLLGYADNVLFSRPFVQGVIARMSNDPAKARTAFTAARAEQEKILQAQPDEKKKKKKKSETDQKQTRSSTPGQTKKMTNVIRNVIAIAILPINGKGGVVDSVGPLRRRDRATLTRRSSRVTASTAASHAQNNPTL